ncbi:Uncharacterised protein [Klebsiella pneumoniae]|uniref:Uncharacterized protein n=1 Tax=Klebsiella pneumoniae TaxID=573 RepID=A0A377XCX7_KLEPN|nr:Uncharacterised protein [Klebsiella pneumoniae]
MTSLKTSIKTITYLSDIGCLEIQGASLKDKKQAPSCELQGAKFMAVKDKLYGMWKAPETVGQKTQMKCKAFDVEEIKTLVSS